MTLFEYLAIAFSLIFSFSAMRLVGGIPHAVQRGRRYWVHLCFVLWQLLITVFIFWAFWSFRDVSWTFPRFALVLLSPALIYFNACALIPENPESVESWRDYFYAVRQRYFVGVGCWLLAVTTISTVVGMPLIHPARGAQVALLAIVVIGARFPDHRVQAGISVALLAITVLIALTLGLRPGMFAAS